MRDKVSCAHWSSEAFGEAKGEHSVSRSVRALLCRVGDLFATRNGELMPRGLLARHPELNHHSMLLDRSGAWRRWQARDARLGPFETLEALRQSWEAHRDVPCYPAIAALARLGSRRGHHDDDAAIAVLVVLHRDVDCVAEQLRRVCEPDDLLWAVWEAVKRAEPQMGLRAPYFLLHRAKESLLTVHRRTAREVACAEVMGSYARGDYTYIGIEPALKPDEEPVTAEEELFELLCWAERTGAIAPEDARLLRDLVHGLQRRLAVEESLTRAGNRLGVGMRSARRRRDTTIQRLRVAVPEYLAAAS